MKFHVGAFSYTVRVMENPIYDEQGRLCTGRALEHERLILIAADAPSRLETLTHEIRHAWAFHCPAPANEEDDARLAALINTTLHKELQAQGGEAMLNSLMAWEKLNAPEPPPQPEVELAEPEHYGPVEMIDPVEANTKASGKRAQCGICETVIGGGSIVTLEPEFSPAAGGMVCKRFIHCAHCEHLQHWLEGVDAQGNPNGAVVDGPFIERGEAVEKFLNAHPEAVGMFA